MIQKLHIHTKNVIMIRYYTGIGSRETPVSLQKTINDISTFLENKGYILRSGGAEGADVFFEEKVDEKNKEIYLPWKGFNNNKSLLYGLDKPKAMEIAEMYHPNWRGLTETVRKIMARNSYQVLGYNLELPSEFVVCYTVDGKSTGGTGQALRIAADYKIPIVNLQHSDWRDKLKELIIK